jgi:glyoxylase-like metal-dependent hydrolase (beta-lactamase superfamily II)
LSLDYPFSSRPATGSSLTVAEGVHWVRMPLPFALNHINLWVLDDGDRWAIVDTGVETKEICAAWESVEKTLFDGKGVGRVFVTHMHPDHLGLAGWMVERWKADLCISRSEFLMGRVLVADTGRVAPEVGCTFYRAAGFSEPQIQMYKDRFGGFGALVSPIPDSYLRLQDGDRFEIGGHDWEIVTGYGHSPEHSCLYCETLNVVISGDQILPRISSNISVWPTEPAADPLTEWLRSCRDLKGRFADDALVLPAHGKPFHGVNERLQALTDGHEEGLEKLLALCRKPRRAVDVFAALFKGRIDERNLMLATGESIAHLNCLVTRGAISADRDANGVDWYQAG